MAWLHKVIVGSVDATPAARRAIYSLDILGVSYGW